MALGVGMQKSLYCYCNSPLVINQDLFPSLHCLVHSGPGQVDCQAAGADKELPPLFRSAWTSLGDLTGLLNAYSENLHKIALLFQSLSLLLNMRLDIRHAFSGICFDLNRGLACRFCVAPYKIRLFMSIELK